MERGPWEHLSTSRRRNCKCKDPETEVGLMCLGKARRLVELQVRGVGGPVLGKRVRDGGGSQRASWAPVRPLTFMEKLLDALKKKRGVT